MKKNPNKYLVEYLGKDRERVVYGYATEIEKTFPRIWRLIGWWIQLKYLPEAIEKVLESIIARPDLPRNWPYINQVMKIRGPMIKEQKIIAGDENKKNFNMLIEGLKKMHNIIFLVFIFRG